MNILYIASIFPTEKEGGNLYTDLAKELAKNHKVTVVVAEGKNKIAHTQLKKEMGVDVLRVKIGNMYGVSFVEKGISIITMQGKMKKAIKNYLSNEKYDLILFMAPPVTFESVIKFAMKKYKAKSYLMQKDIFPQNSVDIGIMSKKNPMYYYFRHKEKQMYKIASMIGCMSEGNIKYILKHNKYLEKEKLELFPNTIKVKNINQEQTNIRSKYGIDKNKILAMYGGNFGKPQGIDFIIRILEEYKNDDRVVFFFSGKGTEKEKLFNFVKKERITNVITQDYIPREDYENILKETDIGFVFLDYRFTIPNTPSRILPYFEYGIPVMAATDKNTDYKDILVNEAKAGLWCESNNIEDFKKQFDILLNNSDKRKKMGKNGRKYLEENWTVEKSVKILESAYNKLNGGTKMEESIFKGKTLLITGGTGSFGHAVLNRFLDTDIGEIRIFSRDEKKQDDMRKEYHNDKIKFYIGDVRDLASVKNAMHGVDYIFHAAALKQVPSCEFFPLEAVKTNVIGTDNVLTAAIDAGVKKVICLSTDKAAYPVNAMGTSKAMMEKVIVAKSRTVNPEKTTICATRYGNVMCSRGSVIPLFIEQIKAGKPLTITEPKMTRFIMSLEEAVELVVFAFQNADVGDIMVQKAPACTIEVLAQAVKEIFGAENEETKIIGIRHGEKMYETLLTNEECAHAIDMGNFYRVPCDKRDLNYDKYFVQGNEERTKLSEFNSNNTDLLNVEQVKEKLLKLDYIQNELKDWNRGNATVEANKLFGSN